MKESIKLVPPRTTSISHSLFFSISVASSSCSSDVHPGFLLAGYRTSATDLALYGGWKLWGCPNPEDLGWKRRRPENAEEEDAKEEAREGEEAVKEVLEEVQEEQGAEVEEEDTMVWRREGKAVEDTGEYRHPVRFYEPPNADGQRWTTSSYHSSSVCFTSTMLKTISVIAGTGGQPLAWRAAFSRAMCILDFYFFIEQLSQA